MAEELTNIRVVVMMSASELERLDNFHHDEKFPSRGEAVRAVLRDHLDARDGITRPEPTAILEPQPPFYARPGMLPGEDIPQLRFNRKDCHGLTPLVAQRLQPLIDDTRRLSFTEPEILAATFGAEYTPKPGDTKAIAECMTDLNWQKRLIREGQPRGCPLTVYSAVNA